MPTFSACIIFSSPELTPAFIVSSLHGIIIPYLQRIIDHRCKCTWPILWIAPCLVTQLTFMRTDRIQTVLLLKVKVMMTTELLSQKPTHLPLSQTSLDTLQATINPLQECDGYGVHLYMDCVRVVYQLMLDDQLLD